MTADRSGTLDGMDWNDVDPSALFDAIRRQTPAADAERMIWALERVLGGARIDPLLVEAKGRNEA